MDNKTRLLPLILIFKVAPASLILVCITIIFLSLFFSLFFFLLYIKIIFHASACRVLTKTSLPNETLFNPSHLSLLQVPSKSISWSPPPSSFTPIHTSFRIPFSLPAFPKISSPNYLIFNSSVCPRQPNLFTSTLFLI